MSRRSRGARTRRTSGGDDSEEEYHNPVAPPPRVGLNLGQGGALPAFAFHSQLLPNKAVGDQVMHHYTYKYLVIVWPVSYIGVSKCCVSRAASRNLDQGGGELGN